MATSRVAKDNLSLAYFLVRSQSLLFYRQILKSLRRVDPAIAHDIKVEVRNKFESNRHVTDPNKARLLLQDGRAEFKQLCTYLSLAGSDIESSL